MTDAHIDEPIPFQGEVHPYADRWPMRTADEIENMAASIAANGQRLPIILTPDGVLVDGRNRLRACEVANVEPKFEVRHDLTTPMSVAEFVWDVNGDLRRHMPKGALAVMAALKPGPQRALSAHSGLSEGYINKARQVIEFCDDDVVQAVIDGHTALNDAYTEAQQIKATVQAEEIAERKRKAEEKARAEREAKQLHDLRANRPDLDDLVEEGRLALSDALSVRSKDIAKEAQAERMAQEKRRKLNADFAVHVVTLAGLGDYADRVDDLINDWDTSLQLTPVTPDLIDRAISGLAAVAARIQGDS
jgi:ParB-like nuclease domain